ncbi:hypothetical protein [Marinitenerispora sediminis]|uniref:ARB-07466-like C-terminal domain-containing protein n=1 Tax=Marinitenerispora sediminis TaxID=1931232 RepID=A0A368T5Z1_9ACTN|nr:hypothetical protein [Marinitenerispora sediminis]RCV53238.1 hypothetical protein DEF28_10905 [Marinitenerispora sediminis]RCV54937.1 hypothetical protein DEF23_15050 [Marinitenerispora sediminis]RCV59060.1 hypothetical protein DEF24_11185 [Marinitenerispora sediminis]
MLLTHLRDLLRRRRRGRDAGESNVGVGTGLAVGGAGVFALVTSIFAADVYGAGTGGGGSVRAGEISYAAAEVEHTGATVDCGVGNGPTTQLTCLGYRSVLANFPDVNWGAHCTRPGDPQDHGQGQACDFMTNNRGDAGTAEENANGDELARWLMTNHERLGIKYIIWRQRIWNPTIGDEPCPGESTVGSSPPSCWRPMKDLGNDNENHNNHVHVSFTH